MEKNKEKTNVDYKLKLDPEHQRRYLEKLADVNGFDPYRHPKGSQWSKDNQSLPPVTYGDIVNYLVFGRSFYTLDQFKNYKSLEAHMQFTNGWVQDVESHQPPSCENVIMRAKVMHSQRLNEKLLQPWVIVNGEGTIKSAHCTCMAGLAETCTHVAALLFKIEAIVRVRERSTVTGEAAYWMIPGSVNKVGPKVGFNIDLTTAKKRKLQVDQAIESGESVKLKRTTGSSKCNTPAPSTSDITSFFDGLGNTGAAVLSILPGHCEKFIDPVQPTKIPPSLTNLRNTSLDSLGYNEILNHCSKIKSTLIDLDQKQCERIEYMTRGQQRCPLWYSMKVGRVTASNLHSVCTFDINRPSISTINKVCYPSKYLNVPAVAWGVQNESKAREVYQQNAQKSHVHFYVQECGLVLNSENCFLGASPDALISCDCCGQGCLEIKCPYKYKDSKIIDALNDKDFCLANLNGQIVLKESHPYYYQVQAQMFVTKTEYCDFFVWTTVDFMAIRIKFNIKFMSFCKEKAKHFFYNVSLPELASHFFTKEKETQIPSNVNKVSS